MADGQDRERARPVLARLSDRDNERVLAVTRLGLFADGPVGASILSLLAERCVEQLSYVVVPSSASAVAQRHGELGLNVALLCCGEGTRTGSLPRFEGAVPDVVLLAWWPMIVRRPFLEAGQKATLNLHPSLLPYGRGKDPNFWALADDEPYGVTIHHVDEGVDSGAIAFQAGLSVGWEDTGATLYARSQALAVSLFSASLDAILSLSIPRIPQPSDRGSFHKRAQLEPRSLIDLDGASTGRHLLNLLRARTFPPHPACRFKEGDATYQVRVQIEKVED